MFTIDQKTTETDLKEKNLFKVLVSMNNHNVATPDTSLEEARSYVFFFREGKNRMSVYIGLHLLHVDRNLFYAHSANPFSEDKLPDIEDEARNFAEDLGAMLDEVDFASMSDLERDRWIEDQSIFSKKKQPEAAPVEQPPQPEVAAAAPAAQSPSAPKQPAPEVQATVAAEPAAVPAQPIFQPQPEEIPEMPYEAPEPAPVRKSSPAKSAPLAAAKRRQEITQKAATTGSAKSSKQTTKGESPAATGVVSRDREALARLLTSF